MDKKQQDPFIGTHARIVLSDWKVLSNLVSKHTQLIKEQQQEKTEEETSALPPVISQREIEDAIYGPMQGFFKQLITAYTKLSRIRMNITMMEDDSFREKRAKLSDEEKVPESILKNTSLSDLSNIQKILDQLATEQEQQWEQLREQWIPQILQHLNEQELALSDIEIKEFNDPEPISELLDRFVALNIDLPKTRKTEMNFSNYFRLKACITIQSALSRQHLPHTAPDIQKILNKLKSDFNTIRKQESEILKEQGIATNEAVASIS